jgi:hypothetical protein
MAMVVWTMISATYVLTKTDSWTELIPNLDANSLGSFIAGFLPIAAASRRYPRKVGPAE